MLSNLRLAEEVKRKLERYGSLRNLEFLETRSGLKTIRKGGILVHSAYDPVREAENLISSLNLDEDSSYLIVLLGVGLGYHLKILKERYPRSVVLPLELDDDIALAFTRCNEDFIITNYNLKDIYTFLNFTDFTAIREVKFLQVPSLYRLNRKEYNRVAEDIGRIVKSKFADLLTRVNFDKLWVKNSLLNLPYLLRYGTITQRVLRESFEDFVGKPFVVLGAGYSGLFLLEEMRKYRDRFVLCVVDTALKSAVSFGLKPDFVFSLDSQFANLKDFFGVRTEGLRLLADIVVSPELIRNFKGNIFITKSSHMEVIEEIVYEITNSVVSWIEDTVGYRMLGLESGGSVSTNLFHFALLMGGNPVFLVGVDLGFPYIIPHSNGSPSHEHSILVGNTFSTSDTLAVSLVLKEYITLEGVKKEKCITHKIMETYKLWFDSASETSNLENVYNISDGVKLRGIKNLPTGEGKKLFSSILSSKPPIKVSTNITHDPPTFSKHRIISSLREVSEKTIVVANNITKSSLDSLIREHPFVLNVVSKSLFPFFRGQKKFEDCGQEVAKDLAWLVNILSLSIERVERLGSGI